MVSEYKTTKFLCVIIVIIAMENLGLFYDHVVYFTAIEHILWPFGIFCGHLVFFPRFGILYQEKSGNPGLIKQKIAFYYYM
jgi:hypothetical protein